MTRFWKSLAAALAVVLAAGTLLVAADNSWNFPVPSQGGLTTGALIYARDSSHLGNIDAVASGQVLASAGTSTVPAYTDTPQGLKREVISAASGTTALTALQSGALVVNTGTSGTTTFTLPAAAAGLQYCFVENGDAAGELLINVQPGDNVVGKTQPSETGTGINTAAGTGIKNTAATNVKGDFTCLVAVDDTTWVMVAEAGVWASQ